MPSMSRRLASGGSVYEPLSILEGPGSFRVLNNGWGPMRGPVRELSLLLESIGYLSLLAA